MTDIHTAIRKINSNAKANVYGSDIETCTIEWVEGTSEISKADIKTKMDELQVEYDAQDYARKREGEYPKIGDQLDKIYHEGIDAWKADMITPIKNKYPKE